MNLSPTKEQVITTAFLKQFPEKKLTEVFFAAKEAQANYLALSFKIANLDVLAAVEQVENKNNFLYYWEKPIDEFSMAAGGEVTRIVSDGPDRFRYSSAKGKELIGQVHHASGLTHQNAVVHLLGGFSFYNHTYSSHWDSFKAASFTLPEWCIIKEGKCTILTICVDLKEFFDPNLKIEQLLNKLEDICNAEDYALKTSVLSESISPSDDEIEHAHDQWVETILKAKREIHQGTFNKVVLARELTLETPIEISDTFILNQLRTKYPDCYSFMIRQDDTASFIGSTPERLASFTAHHVLTEGLAGSTSRGATASEDALLEYNLLHSSKDLEEHEIVLEAIEDHLARYSELVSHPKAPIVKKLSNVQHLYTPITATIREGVSRTEVLKNLHPTPAVGGFPRDEAVSFIQQEEAFDRGWYAGPIGWINANGIGEFAVAIRSGLISENEVRFFAGCGIVQDSDPEKEWEETNMKLIPMLSALKHAGI